MTNERQSNIWNYTYIVFKLIFKKYILYREHTVNMNSLGTYTLKLFSRGPLCCQTSTCQRLPGNWVLMALSDETQVAEQWLHPPQAGIRPYGWATAVTQNLRTALTRSTQFPCQNEIQSGFGRCKY